MEVRKGRFREDLWYRLNVFPITVPPLKQRTGDVVLLVEHFVKLFTQKLGKEITSVAPAALKELTAYSWPGNIRELANVIERAVINSHSSNLRLSGNFGSDQLTEVRATTQTLEEMEREHITRTLTDAGWRIEGPKGAAKVLGINPSTLRTRMGKLGIQKPEPTTA
jgi:transcriptional regulator with GAF, ATPase, and Fis domain